MKVIDPNYVTGYSTFARASVGTCFDRSRALQTVAANVQRINWNPGTGAFEGVLVEPARTNYLVQTNVAAYRLTLTQTLRFGPGYLPAGVPYTLSFYGTGAITLSGVVGATVVGSGAWVKTKFVFTPSAGTLTFSPSGDALFTQCEQGAYDTSWIPTAGSPASRAADVVGPAGMFQTSFVESTADYSFSINYMTGAVVRVEARLYESLVDDNFAFYPPSFSEEGMEGRKWLDIGPTNQFACVDQTLSVASVGPGPMQTFALRLAGPANVVGLVNVKGSRVHVAFNDLAGNIYTNSSTSIGTSLVLVAHPGGPVVSVCVESDDGEVRIGECLAGAYVSVGDTEEGLGFSIIDYGLKKTTKQGKTSFVQGDNAKRMVAGVIVKKSDYNAALRLYQRLTGKPTIHVASEDPDYSEGAIVYGNVADFYSVIDGPVEILFDIEVQGLT